LGSGAWEAVIALLWTGRTETKKGKPMPDLLDEEDEPLLKHPGSAEAARHLHDYEKFTGMMKWGAIICLIIGIIVLLIL
jgi:hypothetical protein